jgi:hypothetical protein
MMRRALVLVVVMLVVMVGYLFAGKTRVQGERIESPTSFAIALPMSLQTQPAWTSTELADKNIDGINIKEVSISHDAAKGEATVSLKMAVKVLVEAGDDKIVDLLWVLSVDGEPVVTKRKEHEMDEDELNKGKVKHEVPRAKWQELFSGSEPPQLRLSIKVTRD